MKLIEKPAGCFCCLVDFFFWFACFYSELILSVTCKATRYSIQCYSLFNILYMLFSLSVFYGAVCIVWCLLLYCFYCLYLHFLCSYMPKDSLSSHCTKMFDCVAPLKNTMRVTSNEDTCSQANCVKEVTAWQNNHHQLKNRICFYSNRNGKMVSIYRLDASH